MPWTPSGTSPATAEHIIEDVEAIAGPGEHPARILTSYTDGTHKSAASAEDLIADLAAADDTGQRDDAYWQSLRSAITVHPHF